MFTHRKAIIAITKQSVQISVVAMENPPRKLDTKTYPLAGKKLSDIVTAIAPSLRKTPVLILLSDDLSYTLMLTIPSSASLNNERAFVAEQIKTEIPEILENNEWDFKEVKKTANGKQVVVFAPVKKFFLELSQAITKAGIKIDAIEPVSIAHARHEDPIIGLALKQDIRGKDEEVLNVVPKEITAEKNSKTNTQIKHTGKTPVPTRSPKRFVSKRTMLILAGIVLISVAGYGAYTVFNRESPPAENSTVDTTVSPLQSPEPAQDEPQTSPTPIDMSIFTVQVLNGTGEAGASGDVRDLIDDMGFGEIDVGNAESFTHNDTQIQKKENVPDEIITLLSEKLTGYTIVQSDPLTNDFDYDVLITVGEKS